MCPPLAIFYFSFCRCSSAISGVWILTSCWLCCFNGRSLRLFWSENFWCFDFGCSSCFFSSVGVRLRYLAFGFFDIFSDLFYMTPFCAPFLLSACRRCIGGGALQLLIALSPSPALVLFFSPPFPPVAAGLPSFPLSVSVVRRI